MKRTALLLTSFAFVLVVFEVGFRLWYEEPWWVQLAGVQRPRDRGFGPMPRGALAQEVDRPRPPRSYRILFLGDSFTAGVGVADSSTFVRIVERELNERQPVAGIDVYEAANGGIAGSMTEHWVGLYRLVVDRFEPDLVVAVFFLRDGASREVTSLGLIRDIAEGMNDLAERSLLYRHSYLYRYFRERAELRTLSDRYLGILRTSYLGGAEDTEEWRLAQSNLLWLASESARRESAFALVVFPVLIQLNEDYPLREVCDVIEAFADANDLAVASLLPDFLGQSAPDLWVSRFDQHPNERGHALAADGLLRFITPLISAGANLARDPPLELK